MMSVNMKETKLDIKALGGGMIQHSVANDGKAKITISGSSNKYGRADHQLTEEIIKADK